MRAIIQRVTEASLQINQKQHTSIGIGLLVLLGICADDTPEDAQWLVNKIFQMRIFNDSSQKMNLSLESIGAELLLVSQFTLFANTKKGNRPSFMTAAKPEFAIPLYEQTISLFEQMMTKEKVKTGVFGANMHITLTNNGPVTIILDTKNKE